MLKFNADEQDYDSIEIVIEGKSYIIEKITQTMFDRIKETGIQAKLALQNGKEDINVLFIQLGIILNESPKTFENIDIRKVSAALRFCTNTITKQIEGTEIKND